jgi:dimethylargininase
MRIAVTRDISAAINECLVTHLPRQPIGIEVARAQHRAYEERLVECGCTVTRLEAGPDLPDSVFIEDTAIVLDEVAIITRPGAPARRLETPLVARALAPHRPLRHIDAPAMLDGGDVLAIGRRLFVARSSRTNTEAINQLGRILGPFGYLLEAVPVQGCLHLKSAVSAVADDTLLINRRWVPADCFADFALIDVHPAESSAANALRVGDEVIYPSAFQNTRQRLEDRGICVRTVDVGELAKAEGGVTCCSLIFRG